MEPLQTLDRLLEHVIDVEREMITLSAEAHRRISAWITASGGEITDDVVEALQYQDILSQQLSATIEAIESVRRHVGGICDASSGRDAEGDEAMERIDTHLAEILETAQSKRLAFGGRVHQDDDEGIEFF